MDDGLLAGTDINARPAAGWSVNQDRTLHVRDLERFLPSQLVN